MKRKTKKLAINTLLLGFFVFILKISIANAESSFSGPVLALFWVTVAGSIVVGGFVFVLGLYFVYKYRESNNVTRNRVKNEGKYEKIWISVAIILVVILVIISTPTLYAIYEPSNTSGATVIDIQAHRFGWNVQIPTENITSWCGNFNPRISNTSCSLQTTGNDPNHLTVPSQDHITLQVGKYYELNLTSYDVNHAFFAYDLAIKVDAIPGQFNTRFFTITQPGKYVVTCAEYCGTNHYQMQFDIIAK